MLYNIIYWLFINHFVELAWRAKQHWNLLVWEKYCKDIEFYSKSSDKCPNGHNKRRKAKPYAKP